MNKSPEYRPCIITDDRRGRVIDGEIVGEVYEHKALFHFWTQRHQYYNNAYGYGAYAQPQHTVYTMAIVEFEDGSVHEVLPGQIRFADGKVKEYDFKAE